MRHLISNSGYFFKEAKITIRTNLLSNITTLLSMALIFLLLSMVMSGWWISSHVIEAIQDEAEISAYYTDSITSDDVSHLADAIRSVNGVRDVQYISEEEAYARMEGILGKEARVLEYFDENPFSPFIEIKIELEKMDDILQGIQLINEIEYVRDNRDVLDTLRNLAGIIKFFGYLIITAVGISTLVIISHIIRLGIDNNREQINTLLLLGAPDSFIACPFLLVGLLLSIGGGILAAVMSAITLKNIFAQVAAPLPFIPLPPLGSLVWKLVAFIVGLSTLLGAGGSLFGLRATKKRTQ